MQPSFDETYWTQRYENLQTGWDIGRVSPPLKAYADQLTDAAITILIPGSGNSYEAAYLYNNGFKKVFIVDISAHPLKNFLAHHPEFPPEQALHQDFFSLQGQYDLILEQTFFCALPPAQRPQYAEKMHDLLKPGGKLAGVLFDDPLYDDHPPFGGNKEEYLNYFEPHFHIRKMERCYNSLPPRQGRELFILLEKPTR
ncbi:MAG: methyltransferase [Cyclobacteriaceae bacterium]